MTAKMTRLTGSSNSVQEYMQAESIVNKSPDEYYAAKIEGAETLVDLDGNPVTQDEFKSWLEGYDKEGNISLSGKRKDHVLGADITLSVDKSVSLAWANADPEQRKEIEKAVMKSWTNSLKSIEIRDRDGALIKPDWAIAFHLTNREGEPQLHAHGVVCNNAATSIDMLSIGKQCKQANAIMHSVQAKELMPLGYDITTDNRGVVIPAYEPFRDANSSRRKQILDKVEELTGSRDTKHNQQLADKVSVATRKHKDETNPDYNADFLEEKWAKSIPVKMKDCLNPTGQGQFIEPEEMESLTDKFSGVAKESNVIVAVIEDRLGEIVSVKEAEREMDKQLLEGKILAYSDGSSKELFYATAEQVEIDNNLLGNAQKVYDTKHGVEPLYELEGYNKDGSKKQLNKGQREAVRAACGEAGLILTEGLAGVGKTASVVCIANSYKAEGYNVVGLTTGNNAAMQLAADGKFPATSIAHCLHHETWKQWDDKTLVVVDEGGMVSLQDMNRILEIAAEKGAKVIVQGDIEQLDAVRAANGMEPLVQKFGSSKIDEVFRQKNEQYKKDVIKIRDGFGDIDDFSHTFHNGRKPLIKAVIANAARDDLIICNTNKDVAAFNNAMRGKWGINDDAKIKCQTETGVREVGIGAGDKIAFSGTVKYGNERFVNNQRAEVISCNAEGIKFKTNGKEYDMTWDDMKGHNGDAVQLRHAWASTTYKTQGLTVGKSHVLVNGMDKRAMYVAASRSVNDSQFYIDEKSMKSQLAKKGTIVKRSDMVSDINRRIRISNTNKSTLNLTRVYATPRLKQLPTPERQVSKRAQSLSQKMGDVRARVAAEQIRQQQQARTSTSGVRV